MIMRRSFSTLALFGLAVGGALLASSSASGSNGRKGRILPKGDEFEEWAVSPSEVDPLNLMVQYSKDVVDLGGPEGLENFALTVTDTETLGTGNYLVGLGNVDWFPTWTKPNMDASAATKEKESRAARNGYMDNPKSMQSSPYNSQNWSFGSGGWYGFVPSTGLGWLKRHSNVWGDPNYSPFDVFDPWRSTVALGDFCYRVQGLGQWKALPAKERTWTAVKRAMRGLVALSDWQGNGAGATINASMPGRLLKYGLDPAFAKQLVPTRPENWNPQESWNLVQRLVPSAYLLKNAGMGSNPNA